MALVVGVCMKVKGNEFWIEVIPDPEFLRAHVQGKWVAFFPRPYSRMRKHEKQAFIRDIQALVCDNHLPGAMITAKRLDCVVFFTSADRDEIWRTKQMIREHLRIKDENLLWKADFETDLDWKPGKGALWFLSELADSLENQRQYLRQGWVEKAERIQTKRIETLLSQFSKRLLEESIMNRRSMIVTPAFPHVDYEIDPLLLFIIMPYGEDWSDDVYFIIKEAGDAAGLTTVRGDDIFDPTIVVNDIWRMINNAGLIIADITVHNANVFYELGISHTLGKKVLVIRQEDGEASPFDVSFWRSIEYGLAPRKASGFKDTLIKIFRKHRSEYGKL